MKKSTVIGVTLAGIVLALSAAGAVKQVSFGYAATPPAQVAFGYAATPPVQVAFGYAATPPAA